MRLLETVGNTTTIEVVYRKLNRHLIARQNLDVVHPHLAGNVSEDLMSVFKFHLKHGVWQSLKYGTT